MKSLALELKEESEINSKKIPFFLRKGVVNAIEENGSELKPVQLGDKLDDGMLLNHNSEEVKLSTLIKDKPAIISFYRGAWCPYCNLELRHYDKLIAEHKEEIQMIAISPEKADVTMETMDIEKLNFTVLSDIGNKYAKKLGLLYKVSNKVKLLFKAKGVDLEKSQGNSNGELPLAATYVIDKNGIVTNVWFDTNFTKRAEPTEVIEAYQKLKA